MSPWKQSMSGAYASAANSQSHPIYTELDKLTSDMRADYDRMLADQQQAASEYVDRLAVGREGQIAWRKQELMKNEGIKNLPEAERGRQAQLIAEQQIDMEIEQKVTALGQMHQDRCVYFLEDAKMERTQSVSREFNHEHDFGLGE